MATSPLRAEDGGGYSYARTLEGVVIVAAEGAEREELSQNQPLLAGDRVSVAPRGRLEIALSDGNLLRIDGDSSLILQKLAGSPDRDDPVTVLELEHGNVQLVVDRDAVGDQFPRIETGNVTIDIAEPGVYRVTGDGEWTELTVRRGEAELIVGREREVVGSSETAVIEGWHAADVEIRTADREDALERWGRDLDREADDELTDNPVDPSLRYRAASLSRYGRWDRVDGQEVWIPRVAADWRPYSQGRWTTSPLGLTWVSYESWGWVPYHYGTWDYLPGYGWAWYPGRTFGPSWVYWYWTNDYAAWIPTGYYVRYYGGRHGWDVGFRYGVYGWAGGSWDYYSDWNFCNTRYVGRRDQNRNTYRGDRFSRDGRHAVPRGIVTTDTRDITRDRLNRPDEILDTLRARRRRGDGDLPDVTHFVARRGELPKEIRGEILVDREARRRGTERTLPDDSLVQGGADNTRPRPTIDTAGTPERERRARGRVLDSRTPDAAERSTGRLPNAGDTRSRERTLEPRSTDEDRRIGRGRRAAPESTPAGREPDVRPRRSAPVETSPPADDSPGEEIGARRRRVEDPPPTADRPPIHRVIEGARRSHPPSPPPAAPSGSSAEPDRTRQRARTVDTAERARRAQAPKPESPPPTPQGSARSATPRERAPEAKPPAKDEGERRRRPRPPGA